MKGFLQQLDSVGYFLHLFSFPLSNPFQALQTVGFIMYNFTMSEVMETFILQISNKFPLNFQVFMIK